MIHTPSIVCGIYIIGTYIVGSILTSSHSWAHILAPLVLQTNNFYVEASKYLATIIYNMNNRESSVVVQTLLYTRQEGTKRRLL